jgi:hypothetical protein
MSDELAAEEPPPEVPEIATQESSDSPYMLLPDGQSSEMRLVIEGSDDARLVSVPSATQIAKLQLETGGSQCCLLL